MPSTRAGATPAATLALAALPATAASAHVREAPLRGSHLPRARRDGARARLATTVLRRGSALLGGLALALVGTLAGASAAQAHDVLQGTDPADGSTVPVAPDHVTLTFTEPALLVGTEIVVRDPNERTVSTGAPVLVDNTITQEVTGELPAGVYTVVYRVTSDDGHPIEGQFAFTASGGVAYGVPTTTSAPSAAPTPTASAPTAAPTPTTSASVAPAAAERHVSAGQLIGIAAVLVVVGGVVAWALLRRRPAA
ncbi:copper resistance CopC family protein [Cellulomonas sp. P5_E12]